MGEPRQTFDLVIDVPTRQASDADERYPQVDVAVSLGEAHEASDELTRAVTEVIRETLRTAMEKHVETGGDRRLPARPYRRFRDKERNIDLAIIGSSLAAGDDPWGEFFGLFALIAGLVDREGIHAFGGQPVCVCAVVGGPPGVPKDCSNLLKLLEGLKPIGEQGVYKIAVYFDEDVLRLDLDRSQTLPSGQTEITLRSHVGWAKAIAAWTYCTGTTEVITHPGDNRNLARSMLLQRTNCTDGDADTIVFRKPKFLGGWHEMYHWEAKPFWQLHGGRRATYTWIGD